MKLICGTIFFNEIEFLEKGWLQYHYDLFDEIILIDGAYKDFPHTHPIGISTDYSLNYIGEFMELKDHEKKIKLILPPPLSGPWKTEIEKRSQYLKYTLPGDWLLVVDMDSWIFGDFVRLREHLRSLPEHIHFISPRFIDYDRIEGTKYGAKYPEDPCFIGGIRCGYHTEYYMNHWTIRYQEDGEWRLKFAGPWWDDQFDFKAYIHTPFFGWKHFPRERIDRHKAKIPYYQMHHLIEDLEPWKWPEEEWLKIDWGTGENINYLKMLRKGYMNTMDELEELGWL